MLLFVLICADVNKRKYCQYMYVCEIAVGYLQPSVCDFAIHAYREHRYLFAFRCFTKGMGHFSIQCVCIKKEKFPHSLPSVESRADPGVQAVSPQLTLSHQPDSRLPLLSARHALLMLPFVSLALDIDIEMYEIAFM